jgi:hypothetical protein
VNKIRIEKKMGSLAMTHCSTEHRKEKTTYKEYKKSSRSQGT